MNDIWVFGGANIDVCGTSVNKLIEYDSNIANIELSFGGVGRNIAQSAALFLDNKEHCVRFITCFSNDHYGEMLRNDCEELGMDIGYSIVSDKYPTSMYLAILDNNRDMRIAMSDMRILDEINREVIEKAIKDIGPGDIVVVDSNFPDSLLRFIRDSVNEINSSAETEAQPGARVRIASDPVSINKIDRLIPIISDLSIFKPNKIEAEALTGIAIKDEESARQNLEWFLDKGVEEIIITMASDGVLLGVNNRLDDDNAERDNNLYWYMHREIEMDSANGGGDAFMGAYLSSRIIGIPPEEAVEIAIATAIHTIERVASARRNINRDIVREFLDDCDIRRKDVKGHCK